MIRLFKGLYISYWAVVITGCVIIILCGAMNFIESMALRVCLMFIWTFICMITAFAIASKKYMAILHKLYTCHVGEYIEEIKKLLPQAGDDKLRRSVNIDLFWGYFHGGDVDECEELLWELTPKDGVNKRFWAYYKVRYYIAMSEYYAAIGDNEKSCEAWEKLMEALENKNVTEITRQRVQKVAERRECLLDVQNGDVGEAEEYFTKEFEKSDYELDSVGNMWILACVYDMKKNYELRDECIKYIKENGGDTRFVKWVGKITCQD